MTAADEEFRDWFMLQSKMPYRTPEEIAGMAWFASKSVATKATAARCVEICYDQSHDDTKRGRLQAQSVLTRCAAAIKQEFDLE